jgi:hypothetical protein
MVGSASLTRPMRATADSPSAAAGPSVQSVGSSEPSPQKAVPSFAMAFQRAGFTERGDSGT